MTDLSELLTLLGTHFPLVAVGCAEAAAAAFLLGSSFRRRPRREARIQGRGAEQTFLRMCRQQSEEAALLLRRSDLLPLYAAGDLPALLGVDLHRLQEDLSSVKDRFQPPESAARFWADYQRWDGTAVLTRALQTAEGEWIRISVRRAEDGGYDLFSLHRETEAHRTMEEYERRLEQTEEASRSKTTFLSRMSHEIRTPMNGIIGMLTLAEGKLPPDHPAMQYLTKADEQSDHLLSLINDILDMSRIEAGKVELEAKPFQLKAFGTKLYDMFSKTLDAKGIRYAVEYEDVTVDWLVGDELRLSQAVINFLSNAVKFTAQGEIVVTFRQMMLREGSVDLMIRVHDTGIGMAPEFVERIFRPFEQESVSTARQYGGTGLGMAITDQIVHLMGGQIVVDSMPGRGSDFSLFLTLPLSEPPAQPDAAPEPAEEAAPADDAFRGRRILMAEDNELNAMIAAEILQEMGAQLQIAGNGQEAVDRFAESAPGWYDFILMDVQMPVMDGRTAAWTIRAMDRPDARTIPIFALSADAFVEDERLSRESGMDGHYSKPVDFQALGRDIGRILREKNERDR